MAAENPTGPLGLVVGAVNPKTPRQCLLPRVPTAWTTKLPSHPQTSASWAAWPGDGWVGGRPCPPHLQREVPAQPHCPELEKWGWGWGLGSGRAGGTDLPSFPLPAPSLGAPQVPRIVYSCPLPETPRTRPAPATQPYLCPGPSPKGALWGRGGLGCNLAVSASWMTWGDPCILEFLRRGDGSQPPQLRGTGRGSEHSLWPSCRLGRAALLPVAWVLVQPPPWRPFLPSASPMWPLLVLQPQ